MSAEAVGTTPMLATFTALTVSNLAPGFGMSMMLLDKGFFFSFTAEQSKAMIISAIALDSKNGLQDIYNLSLNRVFMQERKIIEEPVLNYLKAIREAAKPKTADDHPIIYTVMDNELKACEIVDSGGSKLLRYNNQNIAVLEAQASASYSPYDPRSQYKIKPLLKNKIKLFCLSSDLKTANEQYINYQIQLKENETELFEKLPKVPMTKAQIDTYMGAYKQKDTKTTATTKYTEVAIKARQDKRTNRNAWMNEYIACSGFIARGNEIMTENETLTKGFFTTNIRYVQYQKMKEDIENNRLKEILAHTLAFAAMETGANSFDEVQYDQYKNYFLASNSMDTIIEYFNQIFGLDKDYII